jgi:CubicO group peptidase (beta-lactamase class C family)
MAKETAMVELVWDLVRGRTDGISKVTYLPQKGAFPEEFSIEQPFERCSPEEEGLSSGQILKMLKELKASKSLHMHSVMIIRNGRVVSEAGFFPYQKDLWHTMYSMSKSVVSMAVGLLIDEGKLTLNTKVIDVFRKNISVFGMVRQRELTVEHLLTMTSGVTLNEIGAVAGNNWVKSFLEAPVHHEPGEVFEYNSMNSYLLSAIVTEITGEPLVEYLRPRLFEPLGIKQVFWESCPKGNNKGGWGLYLCIEDMAKLGQLYLNAGKWKGKQILPESWVKESSSLKVVPPEDTGFSGYGYQIWQCRRRGAFAFNGMMGQNVFLYPDMNLLVVTTAGNEVFFNSNELQELLETYLPEEGKELLTLPENPAALLDLRSFEKELSDPHPAPPRILRGGWKRKPQRTESSQKKFSALCGRKFRLDADYVGLFPLMAQVFHNNFSEGISEIGFHRKGGVCFLDVTEGEQEKEIPLGFEREELSDLNLNGEIYRIGTKGTFSADEEGRMVLMVSISYLEDAVKRKMKIFFEKEKVEVRFSEVPGKAIILDGLSSISSSIMEKPLLKKINEKGNVDLIRQVMEHTIEPVVWGTEI